MRKLAVLILLTVAFAYECKSEVGYASWYGNDFHGRKTASGEIFHKTKYTAASRAFPIGTYLLVKNLENGKEVIVRVNDVGPFGRNRIIDLSKSAAKKLGFLNKGIAKVEVRPLQCVAQTEEDPIESLIKTY
ncbi:septal ring lytic transglycosylase RlpA family protein [Thermocrinis minervae]|uniref:Probable endolytic peptidoglycan transglycosylase RlpA n=1 Tax=Thermocrinis minervae TaxID=381751 RepID=A0A1M6T542_9AQUI|nr:septal ring lytic transglycosylase RlpA family protein [Thermocrinis minervae]SHK52113.1 rare lipoprotein A [Thermocrinis minervae]